jgi:hypothetical protein
MTACLCCHTRDPGTRHACPTCVRRIRDWLDYLGTYAAILATWSLEPARSSPSTGSRGGSYSSRPPIRLDAIVMLDPRSRIAAEHDPVVDDPTPLWSITASITALVRFAADATGEEPPSGGAYGQAPRLGAQLRWLAHTALDTLTFSRDIATVYTGLRDLHAQARGIAHDQPPAPLGPCLEVDCDGVVLEPPILRDDVDPPPARCTACRRGYAGLDLIRLRTAEAS